MAEYVDVTAALIRRENSILIARRSSGPRSGLWEFPGGKQEAGETRAECLAREIKEELGLDISVGPHFITVEHQYPDLNIRLHCYFCETGKSPAELNDHHEIRWVKPANLGEFRFPEADQMVAERLMNSD